MTEQKEQAAKAEVKPKAKVKAKEAVDPDEGFNLEAYQTTVRLSFEKMLRKNQKLKDAEQEELDKAKKIAMGNKGPRALLTQTYKVKMQKVQLLEGLPTPPSLVALFPEHLQEKLFA